MESKTVIVTGANTGVGYQTALQLAKQGARVILACRSVHRGEEAVRKIKKENCSSVVFFIQLDLSSLQSVENFVEEFKRRKLPLHVLINNAGINSDACIDNQTTEDGFNPVFQVNYLGHFYLCKYLLPLLCTNAPSRIINVSSVMHRYGSLDFASKARNFVKGDGSYADSKLALLFLTYQLQRKYADLGVTSVAVSPGSVNSDIWRYINSWKYVMFYPIARAMFLCTTEGAATSVFAASDPSISTTNNNTFYYYTPYYQIDCCARFTGMWTPFAGARRANSDKVSYDPIIAKDLWELSDQLLEESLSKVH